jgi:hypothetical protein
LFAALGYSTLFAFIFLFYAGALYFGGYLRWNEIREGGKLY